MRYLKHYKLFWAAVLAAGFAGARLPVATAQAESLADWSSKDYAPPLPVDKRATFPQVGTVLRTGQFDSPNDVQAFSNMYTKRYFPLVTNKDMERGSREDVITILRRDFRQLEKVRTSPAFDTLTDITLDYMKKIALDPKWHPVVRINAMLAIGEVRSPKAAAMLIEFIRMRQLHPALKVAAMADLVNLAERGVLANPADAALVVPLMVVAAKSSPANPSDSLRWMRGQAADVLAAVGSTGRSGEVFAALLVMLGDEQLAALQRGKAARALGKLNYDNGIPDAKGFIKALASFGSDALAPNLPVEPRRIRSLARDMQDALNPLRTKLDTPPRQVGVLHDAMDKLDKAAVKQQAAAAGAPDDDLKAAIAAAKTVCDGIAGK